VTSLSTTAPLQTEHPRLSFDLARVAVLLSVSVLINYVDRGTLSIAAPILKDDLALTASRSIFRPRCEAAPMDSSPLAGPQGPPWVR
jgi:hypothetical protein